MVTYAFKNLAYGVVAVPPNPPTTGVTITLEEGQGALFGVGTICISPSNVGPATIAGESEITEIESISGDTITFTGRATEGPNAARAIQVGDVVTMVLSASLINQLLNG